MDHHTLRFDNFVMLKLSCRVSAIFCKMAIWPQFLSQNCLSYTEAVFIIVENLSQSEAYDQEERFS